MYWKRLLKFAGLSLGLAVLWVTAGSNRTPWAPFDGAPLAAPPKASNPDNPCNPCNPNGGKAAQASNPDNPCNPCNPDGGKATQASNPDNPCNPCNPNGGKAAAASKADNPCNPGAAENPCNPGTATPAAMQQEGGKIGWGRDFKSWDSVTGYVISNAHGNRLVQTYIYPSEAVRVYKHNAELVRLRKTEGYLPYPRGTQIVQESWVRNELGGPGKPGPVFFMRKEDRGYDSGGGDWKYAFTQNDLRLVGEGFDGKMSFCKECHARASRRDHVFAIDR